jgi:outer membrane protein
MKRRIFAAIFFCGCLAAGKSAAQQVLTLEQAIAIALEGNYDVQVATRNTEAANTDNRFAVGAFLPQISGTASYALDDTDQEFIFTDAARNRAGNAESDRTVASAQATWTLFDGTRMFATRARIKQTAQQSELLLKEQMVTTIAAVITNYIDIVRQKQQLRAIQEQMSVNEERVKLAERKLSVGTGAKPELLQARVDLNAQKTSVLQQEALIVQRKDQLNALLAFKVTMPFEVADSISINEALSRDEMVGSIASANYGLQAAQRSVDIAGLSLRERRAELLPTLSATGSYNFAHTNNTKLINPFASVESEIKGFNYGLAVSVPILNGLNTQRQIRLASISLNRQAVLLEQQRTNLNVAASNAFIAYENSIKVLTIEEENILLAKENVAIALESFKRGISTFIELRTAQQSLETAYNRLINARYNAKVAETELLRLSGALLK